MKCQSRCVACFFFISVGAITTTTPTRERGYLAALAMFSFIAGRLILLLLSKFKYSNLVYTAPKKESIFYFQKEKEKTNNKMEGQETGAIAKQHEINVASLESYLLKHLPAELTADLTPLNVSKFKTGQSNPTYLLRGVSCLWFDSEWLHPLFTLQQQQKNNKPGKSGLRLVMRKKPGGKLLSATAHAVEREYRVISKSFFFVDALTAAVMANTNQNTYNHSWQRRWRRPTCLFRKPIACARTALS